MTVEEKLGQLEQFDARASMNDASEPKIYDEKLRLGRVGSFLGLSGASLTRRAQRIAVEQSRLGIPVLFADDVVHGFRTLFPVPLGEAASFDVDAVERAARIAAVEATAYGLHWTYAPMVDIARDPRWGRIVEGSGEDVYLGSAMAAARVRGLQGKDLAANDTMMATAKHFVAYGAAEGGRDYNTVDISQRTLYETYLPPFRAAVEAGVQSVMAAFNEIGGVPMHANHELLTTVLRGQMGFDGVVVSDFHAVHELIDHGVAAGPQEAGLLALRAGVDVEMTSETYLRQLPAAVRDGRLATEVLDQAVRRVLRAKHRLGLFDDPYRYCSESRERVRTLTPLHRQAAREVARKSFVLLKNEGGVLPLSRRLATLAVVGPFADERRNMMGSWAAIGRVEDVVTPLDAIRSAVGAGTRVLHAKGASLKAADPVALAEAERVTREADAVLVFVGEDYDMSGEARSRSSLDLPEAQQALVRALQAIGKPLAVVLFTGRPLTIGWLAQHVSSILLAWYPGTEAGHAIADVIFGDHSPAGRLPVTFPRAVGQVPIYYNHKRTGRPPDAAVEHTSKYLDVSWTPLYPFGHGLSYTSFEYLDLNVSAQKIHPADTVEVRVTLVNTGTRAGDEVVQLYVRDDVASITRPVRQLRGFQRVHLDPDERRTLVFKLGPADLSFYGSDLQPVVEPGTFTVFAGGSSVAPLSVQFEVVGS